MNSENKNISPIIEVGELLRIYRNPEVLIFDVSNGKDAQSNYEKEHIEGALFVDLNTQLADIKSDLSDGGRHPLPSPAVFAKTLTSLGVSKEKHLIVYDDKNGSNAAARFWWMLRSAGQEKVQVLNGGLTHAKSQGFPMSSKKEVVERSSDPYFVDRWNWPIVALNEVEKASQNGDKLIIDVRDKDRYDGKVEPIDLVAGHIPGAINVPFTENLDEHGLYGQPAELRAKYEAVLGIAKRENTIVHCGSGVTACHTLLALDYAGFEMPNLYVGSWSEWSRNGKPMAKTDPEK